MIVCVGGSEVRVRGSAEGSTGETIRMRPRLRPEATDTTLTGTAKQMYQPKTYTAIFDEILFRAHVCRS